MIDLVTFIKEALVNKNTKLANSHLDELVDDYVEKCKMVLSSKYSVNITGHKYRLVNSIRDPKAKLLKIKLSIDPPYISRYCNLPLAMSHFKQPEGKIIIFLIHDKDEDKLKFDYWLQSKN